MTAEEVRQVGKSPSSAMGGLMGAITRGELYEANTGLLEPAGDEFALFNQCARPPRLRWLNMFGAEPQNLDLCHHTVNVSRNGGCGESTVPRADHLPCSLPGWSRGNDLSIADSGESLSAGSAGQQRMATVALKDGLLVSLRSCEELQAPGDVSKVGARVP